MQKNSIKGHKYISHLRLYRNLVLGASIAIFILIVLGGIVRINGEGGACPDYPTCFERFTPPSEVGVLPDYLHRLVTLVAGGFLVAAAVVAKRWFPDDKEIKSSLLIPLGLLFAQIILGWFISQIGLPFGDGIDSAIHLGLSLMILAWVIALTVKAYYLSLNPGRPLRLVFGSSFARHSLFTTGTVFALLVSGVILSRVNLANACVGWILCDGSLIPQDTTTWLSLIHRLIVLAGGASLATLLVRAWRQQRTQTVVITATTAATVLFFAQALLGAKLVQGFPAYLVGLHKATAIASWAALVVQLIAVGLSGRSTFDEAHEAAQIRGRKGLWRDLLMLTKPVVVALLLVTTYAGMVIGAQTLPTLPLSFWTLLAGFMAAGGSGAINQYIDREDDIRMQRTQKRPIPAGRLTPGEGLAFGVAMALSSFYLMVAFVNFLAALLSLAGIIYYVLLYSIFLKKTTVQNIVIGGGAGAIPPLVGWAAATGSLNIPSLFLFAVVFMWTPPHFWALALVRRNDYARAGVPMLPVVRGEAATRSQIFLYTVELVGLTLFLPLFGLGGSIYLIGAGLLGLWLLMAAWKVRKQGGNKLAWKMYRYSSMYLAFLFVVLMVDALV